MLPEISLSKLKDQQSQQSLFQQGLLLGTWKVLVFYVKVPNTAVPPLPVEGLFPTPQWTPETVVSAGPCTYNAILHVHSFEKQDKTARAFFFFRVSWIEDTLLPWIIAYWAYNTGFSSWEHSLLHLWESFCRMILAYPSHLLYLGTTVNKKKCKLNTQVLWCHGNCFKNQDGY